MYGGDKLSFQILVGYSDFLVNIVLLYFGILPFI